MKQQRKRMSADRKQQVATTRERHGNDFYSNIGKQSSGAGMTFRDPEKARQAAFKRWGKKEVVSE